MTTDWIKTLAPVLGSALGGPLAGAAASMIAEKLGLSESTVEAVKSTLAGTTLSADQIASLKLAEIDFKKFAEANKISLAEIEAADRANARNREIALHDPTTRILAILVVFGWLLTQCSLLFIVIDPSMRELVSRVLGTLDAALLLVLSYHFGSSSSSQQQRNTIAEMVKK